MLGSVCGDCSIVVGSDCIPCPPASTFPECAGCVDGVRPAKSDIVKDLFVPVVAGVITTLAIALVTRHLLHE